MKKGLIALGLLVSLLVVSCDEVAIIEDLEEAKTKWENLNTSKYAYDYSYGCECFMDYVPAHITVENGVIVAVDNPADGQPFVFPNGTLVVDSLPALFYTIDELFEQLEDADGSAFIASVIFDATHGFPKEVYIDYNEDVFDDEISYNVFNFEIL